PAPVPGRSADSLEANFHVGKSLASVPEESLGRVAFRGDLVSPRRLDGGGTDSERRALESPGRRARQAVGITARPGPRLAHEPAPRAAHRKLPFDCRSTPA